MTLRHDITGFGPRDAEIIIVKDFPTASELSAQMPFPGAPGRKLAELLRREGIEIGAVRTEFVAERLAGSAEHFYEGFGRQQSPTSELVQWWSSLHQRLDALKHKKVIIAMGDLAVRALTNEYSVDYSHCYVLNTRNGPVIPCYDVNHFGPERFPHETHWLALAISKAKAILNGRKDIEPNLIVRPTAQQAIDYINSLNKVQRIVCDIETDINTHQITVIGFAPSAREAIAIPLKDGDNSYFTPEEEARVLRACAELLANEKVQKIGQNFLFDIMHLTRIGLPIRGQWHDTMFRAHALNPELPKGLRDLGRIYCYCAPWKDVQDWRSTESLWRYNARDCARTFEVYEAQETELFERNLRGFVTNHIEPLLLCIQDCCVRGMLVDQTQHKVVSERLRSELDALTLGIRKKAESVVQMPLERRTDLDRQIGPEEIAALKEQGIIKKGGAVSKGYPYCRKKGVYFTKEYRDEDFNPNSPKQIIELLTALGYKVPKKKGKLCTDKKSMMKMYVEYGDELFAQIVQSGNLDTLYGNYSSEKLKLDPDGRLRWTYGITETGRLNSTSTPWDTGRNIQNFPREKNYNFKTIIIPDLGMVLGQMDLSQAEARVTAHIAGDKLMQAAIYQGDFHQYVADYMTGLLGRPIDRQFAKMINHASNYGMGPGTFLENCLAANINITYAEAEDIIKARESTFPDVVKWRERIRKQIVETRQIQNPFGRTRLIFGKIERTEDGKDWTPKTHGIFRENYAYIPQSTVADVINVIWARLLAHRPIIEVLQQCHDSLLFQFPIGKETEVTQIIKSVSEVTIPIPGDPIVIPTDLEFGMNWGNLTKVKKEK